MTEGSFSSPKNALSRERPGGLQDRLFERREKGLWSFLTWSFFLSQMVGAEQASAAAARSAGTTDETASTNDANAGLAASHAVLSPSPVVLAEMQEAAAVQPVQSLTQSAAPTAFLAGSLVEFAPPEVRSTDESSAVRQTSAVPASPVEIQPAADSAPAVTFHPKLGDDMPGVGGPPPPSIESPPVVEEVVTPVVDIDGDVVELVVAPIAGEVVQASDPVVAQVVAPVVGIANDVVGDVAQMLDPLVEQVVVPVVAIVSDVVREVVQLVDPVVEQVAPVVGAVGDVVEVLDPVLEQMLAPIVDVVGDVVGDAVQALDPVVEQVVAPVVDVVGDVMGDVVQVLDPVVAQAVAPGVDIVVGDTAQVLDPVVEQVMVPVVDILDGPLGSLLGLSPNAGGGSPVLSASIVVDSSSIEFGAQPVAGSLPLDDLFSSSGYSDYNLALQADASVGADPASGGILPDIDIAAELSILTGDTQSDGGHGQGSLQHIGLPSLLGDIGLHGLGL